MTRLFPILPILALLACGGAAPTLGGARLLGPWRSDKAATLGEVDAIGGFTPKARRALEATLGRRTLTYTESRLTSRLQGGGDLTESGPYRIVAIRGNELVLETWDHALGATGRRSVFVDGDRLWIWLAGGKWREFYRRVPTVAAGPPSSSP